MTWFYITILAYFLFAIANIFDRYILHGPLQHPRVYAFYVGISGLFALFLIPFGFSIPSLSIIILSFFAGSAGVAGIYYLFKGIFEGKVSTQVAMVGAFAPIFTLLFIPLVAGERVDINISGFLALGFLILGIIFLSADITTRRITFKKKDVLNALVAGLFFGLGFVLTKMVYDTETFFNGYILTTLGGSVFALLFFLIPSTKNIVFKKNPIKNRVLLFPLVGGRIIGTFGNIAINYAISIAIFGQIAFISALAGIQNLAILIIAAFLYIKKPSMLKETFTKKSLALRFLGVAFVGLGIYLIF